MSEQSEGIRPRPDQASTEVSTEVKADEGTRPYDMDYPEKFKEFMRTGWGESPLVVQARPGGTRLRPPAAALWRPRSSARHW